MKDLAQVGNLQFASHHSSLSVLVQSVTVACLHTKLSDLVTSERIIMFQLTHAPSRLEQKVISRENSNFAILFI